MMVVLIPVHKNHEEFVELQRKSIFNTINIFFNCDIYFVGPKSIEQSWTLQIEKEKWKTFYLSLDNKYFKNVYTYNGLLYSQLFYSKFSSYNNIIIIHPDAWVFSNQVYKFLDYDYIGAPWEYPPIFLEAYDNNNHGLIGNGGLSIRRVEFVLKLLNSNNQMFTRKEIYNNVLIFWNVVYIRMALWKKVSKILHFISLCMFVNKLKYIFLFRNYINEDVFFGVISRKLNNANIPNIEIAASFSVESYIPEILNLSNVLGCHSFEKRSNDFWIKRSIGLN